MELLLDLQSLLGPARERGLGRYSLELAAALAAHERVTAMGVLLNGGVPSADLLLARHLIKSRLPEANVHVFDAPWPWIGPSGAFDVQAHRDAEYVRDAFIRDLQPDAVLVCSLFERPSTSVISVPAGARPFTAVVAYDALQFNDPSCAVPDFERPNAGPPP